MPRILFLDAYDSFSNNIIALLRSSLHAHVTVIKIDDSRFVSSDLPDHVDHARFHHYLRAHSYDAIVAGPGPGDPRCPDDVGLINALWSLDSRTPVAVLGICLGFQSMVLCHGGNVSRLNEPRHGFTTPITHNHTSIFESAGDDVRGTQYHSLRGNLVHGPPARAIEHSLWVPSDTAPDLVPLAWDLSDPSNGPVLMAVKHTTKPFWGLQYHPESICTNSSGRGIVAAWWNEARVWLDVHRVAKSNMHTEISDCQPLDGPMDVPIAARAPDQRQDTGVHSPEPIAVSWSSLSSSLDVSTILELLFDMAGPHDQPPMLLESGTKHSAPVRPETGRFSIIAIPQSTSTTIRYWTQDQMLQVDGDVDMSDGQTQTPTRTVANMDIVFATLKQAQATMKATNGPSMSPFWGGLVGYLSYEAGLETINVNPSPVGGTDEDDLRPDVWFVTAQRSIVVDHVEHTIYVQSLSRSDAKENGPGGWIEVIMHRLRDLTISAMTQGSSDRHDSMQANHAENLDRNLMTTTQVYAPDRTEYMSKVDMCQSHIRAGSSYELCLTDQTIFSTTEHTDVTQHTPDQARTHSATWEMYQTLRTLNPAPFGAYLNLVNPTRTPSWSSKADLTLLSSSPERFMSWSRAGVCQYRPIKGTVKKGPQMTREKAMTILNSRKEQAENLMIVDLIRHDLNGAIGGQDRVETDSIKAGEAGGARVSKLMSVEEYETVYQLVSVIEGDLKPDQSGIDVLATSLPPGSMTGAPKKRSCELLKEIENNRRRGLYSGVMGYLDAGGAGDFSVVIRSLVKWGHDWRVGAGGAVTALSVAGEEFDEMQTKRLATLAHVSPVSMGFIRAHMASKNSRGPPSC